MSTRLIACSVVAVLAGSCSDEGGRDRDRTDEPSASYRPPAIQREPGVAGYSQSPVAIAPLSTGAPFAPPAPIWPAASTVDVALSDATGLQAGLAGSAQIGGLPVSIEPIG